MERGSLINYLNGIALEEIKTWLLRAYFEELQAHYSYFSLKHFLVGNERTAIAEEFGKHSQEELNHADKLLERLDQLGIKTPEVTINPQCWASYVGAPYVQPADFSVEAAVKVNIEAEQAAIVTYLSICAITKDKDIVTYDIAKEILAEEQEHLADLVNFWDDLHSTESDKLMEFTCGNDKYPAVVTDSVEDLKKEFKIKEY